MSGRVVIVTGGTRGIGRSLAEGYVSAGAKVVVASRKADACKETEEHLRALGGEAIGVPAHMGDLDDLAEVVRRAVEEFGGIDVVVNNAATALAQPIGEYTPDAWQKSLDVNLRGPVFLTQAAIPHLKESEHAAVLNVLSGAAFMFSASSRSTPSARPGCSPTPVPRRPSWRRSASGSMRCRPGRWTPTWCGRTPRRCRR